MSDPCRKGERAAGRQSGEVFGEDRHHLDSHQNQGCAALLRPSKSADSFHNSPACPGLTAVHAQGELSSPQPQKQPSGRQLHPGQDPGQGRGTTYTSGMVTGSWHLGQKEPLMSETHHPCPARTGWAWGCISHPAWERGSTAGKDIPPPSGSGGGTHLSLHSFSLYPFPPSYKGDRNLMKANK